MNEMWCDSATRRDFSDGVLARMHTTDCESFITCMFENIESTLRPLLLRLAVKTRSPQRSPSATNIRRSHAPGMVSWSLAFDV